MDIASVSHKGLKDFIEKNDSKVLPQDKVSRRQNVLAALISAPNMEAASGPPGWRIHQLKGDREGQWSISVSGNWRITFAIEDGSIADLNLEDCH
ncbi:MAG: type II toxin-antitoxin system RelE/ParE family toxin [Rhodomicrobiaceae bacterium]